MNPIDVLSPIPETVTSVVHGADMILEVIKKWRQYRISDVTTLKMLYLELDSYMEIIEVMSRKYLSGAKADQATVCRMLLGIELSVTGLILAREDKHSVFRKLMKRGIIRGRKWLAGGRDYENVLQALSFINAKTGILRKIAATGDKKLLKEIKLKERLSNIEESIKMVMKLLVKFKEVNVIARRWHSE